MNIAKGTLMTTVKETTWGVSVSEIVLGDKVWQFVEAPVLTEVKPGYGVVLHPAYVKKRPLQDTILKMNVNSPKANYIEDGFVTLTSMELRLEECMGWMYPS